MRKKRYILIILLMICCGCNAKYELNFNDKILSEKLNVAYPRSDETDSELDEIYTNYLYSIGRESFYNFDKKNSTKEIVNLDFSYDYSNNNIKSSNLIKSCVEYFDFFEEKEKYYLIASGALRCNYYEYVRLESLDIVITTNHNVLENNADEIKNNEYVWHINLDKEDNINIRFITDNKISKESKKQEYKGMIMTIGIALSALALITLFIIIRHKRVNKI